MVVAVGEVLPSGAAALDGDRADRHEFLQGPVDGVRGGLVQPPGQQRPAGHPLPGGLPVAEQNSR